MNELLQRLEEATRLEEVQNLLDRIVQQVRDDQSKAQERRLFLRCLLFNRHLIDALSTSQALDYLFSRIDPVEWNGLFGKAVEKELPSLVAAAVDDLSDVSHQQILRFLPDRRRPQTPQRLSGKAHRIGALPARYAHRAHHVRYLSHAKRQRKRLEAPLATALLHRQ